jgi:hypothetical protein
MGRSISPFVKRAILIGVARLLNTLHQTLLPLYHGHLSSHNIFVELPEDGEL